MIYAWSRPHYLKLDCIRTKSKWIGIACRIVSDISVKIQAARDTDRILVKELSCPLIIIPIAQEGEILGRVGFGRPADSEVGDTAGSEACATSCG